MLSHSSSWTALRCRCSRVMSLGMPGGSTSYDVAHAAHTICWLEGTRRGWPHSTQRSTGTRSEDTKDFASRFMRGTNVLPDYVIHLPSVARLPCNVHIR